MSPKDVLQELEGLPTPERLKVIEKALHSIRQDLEQDKMKLETRIRKRLTRAAKALLPDYVQGGELTSFTALNGEDFHAQR